MAIEATGEVNLEFPPETPEVPPPPPPPPTSSDGDDQSWNAGASLNLDSTSLNLDLNKTPNVVPTPAEAPTLSETPPVAGSSDSFLSATPSAPASASTSQGEATTATVAATATAAVGVTALSSIPIGTAATVAAASASAAGEKTTAEPLKIETAPIPPSVADLAGSTAAPPPSAPSALAGTSTPQGEATTATVAATATRALSITALSSVAGSIPIGTAATVAAASAAGAGEKTTAEPLKIGTAPMPPSVADLTGSPAAPPPATPAALASAPTSEAATTATSAIGVTTVSSVAGSIPIGTAATVAAAVPRLSVSNIQSSADPNGEANRPAVPAVSTIELVTAHANGATNFTDNERSRLIKAGVDPREMGKSDAVIASLPKDVSEPTNAQLGTERAAVKNFLNAAGGEVENLSNANVDPATRGVIAPFASSKDATVVGTDGATASGMDRNALAASGPGSAFGTKILKDASQVASREDTGDNKEWDRIESETAARNNAAGPALKRIEDVIDKSAYGKDPLRYGGASTTNTPTIVVSSADALARFRRNSDAESPGGVNKTGAGKIWVSPAFVQPGSKPEVGALVMVHERTHAEQFAKNPKVPLNKQLPIQAEVQGFEQQLKLYKELRPKLINTNGAPIKGLSIMERQTVLDTERLYQAQRFGGSAAIKKEIKTWDAYKDIVDLDFERKHKPTPGPSDRTLVPFF
jgi:hypothetical protein